MPQTNDLASLRNEIDQLDQELLQILAKRLNVVREVGRLKKREHVAILQPNRWSEVLEKNCKIGSELGLSKQYVIDIWERIHQEALLTEEAEK